MNAPAHAPANTLAPGFEDAVHGSQRVFSALMQAMARPGRLAELTDLPDAPAPLLATTGAVLLAIADYDSTLWLDDALRPHTAAFEWLAFHTGAPRSDVRAEATFAVLTGAATIHDLDGFALGIPDYPDRSTTILLQVDTLGIGGPMKLTGPGIDKEHRLRCEPLPEDLIDWWQANRAIFPLGVDLVLCSPSAIACLPRTVKIVEAD